MTGDKSHHDSHHETPESPKSPESSSLSEESLQSPESPKVTSLPSAYQSDLDRLDETLSRLANRRQFSLWETIDRWGPGAISILTLLVVALILWLYSVKIASIEAELRHSQEYCKALSQRMYVKELKDEKLRDSLLRKGVID